jgi:hypothetical protein
MGSLDEDVLPRSDEAAAEMTEVFGIKPLPFLRAVRRALSDWERAEPLRGR